MASEPRGNRLSNRAVASATVIGIRHIHHRGGYKRLRSARQFTTQDPSDWCGLLKRYPRKARRLVLLRAVERELTRRNVPGARIRAREERQFLDVIEGAAVPLHCFADGFCDGTFAVGRCSAAVSEILLPRERSCITSQTCVVKKRGRAGIRPHFLDAVDDTHGFIDEQSTDARKDIESVTLPDHWSVRFPGRKVDIDAVAAG